MNLARGSSSTVHVYDELVSRPSTGHKFHLLTVVCLFRMFTVARGAFHTPLRTFGIPKE